MKRAIGIVFKRPDVDDSIRMGQVITSPTNQVRSFNVAVENTALDEARATMIPGTDVPLVVQDPGFRHEHPVGSIVTATASAAPLSIDGTHSKSIILETTPFFGLECHDERPVDPDSGKVLLRFAERMWLCDRAVRKMRSFDLELAMNGLHNSRAINLPPVHLIDALCLYMRPFNAHEELAFAKLFSMPCLSGMPGFRAWKKNQIARWNGAAFFGLIKLKYHGIEVNSSQIINTYFNTTLFHSERTDGYDHDTDFLVSLMSSHESSYALLCATLRMQHQILCETLNELLRVLLIHIRDPEVGVWGKGRRRFTGFLPSKVRKPYNYVPSWEISLSMVP